MGTHSEKNIDEIANDLEDLKTTVEELEIESPAQADARDLRTVKSALEQAIDATDALEERNDDDPKQ
jgi:archaellum component FlaC